ncbi:hypothetical protein BV20DRAFT_977675 [Pilatotrama ljubarskyi]|nr:hypothetical protein BV20DRAFT_977675 [Pilatotrama ljubarskyi]
MCNKEGFRGFGGSEIAKKKNLGMRPAIEVAIVKEDPESGHGSDRRDMLALVVRALETDEGKDVVVVLGPRPGTFSASGAIGADGTGVEVLLEITADGQDVTDAASPRAIVAQREVEEVVGGELAEEVRGDLRLGDRVGIEIGHSGAGGSRRRCRGEGAWGPRGGGARRTNRRTHGVSQIVRGVASR